LLSERLHDPDSVAGRVEAKVVTLIPKQAVCAIVRDEHVCEEERV
jgi:hypothetical protein